MNTAHLAQPLRLLAGLLLAGMALAAPEVTPTKLAPDQVAGNSHPVAFGVADSQRGFGVAALRDPLRVQGLFEPGEIVFADRFEPLAETRLQVWVTDTSGVSLAGVRVRADGVTGEELTDSEGRAMLTAPAIDGAILRLDRTGFVPQWRRLDLSTGADDSTPLRIGMVPRAPVQRFNAGDPVTLNGADGAQVMLAANAFVDEDGQPVSGEIDAFITALDVSDPDGLVAFPGGFDAIGEGDAPGSLLTYGVVDFSFEQNGVPLTLVDGQTAVIDIPIYLPGAIDGTLLEPGDIIPLWLLDENDGIWRFKGNAVVVASTDSPTGLALQGEADHFSWWNADLIFYANPGPDFVLRTAYLRPRLHCNNLGQVCPGSTPGAWLNVSLLNQALPRVRGNRWVPATGEPPLVEIPVGFELVLDASVADGFFAIAEATPSPLIANQADEIIDVDIVLKPRHLIDDGWFIPGERLRGWMETIGETHRYRFAGRAGRVFRLRGYPAATSAAGPGISADLAARIELRRGSEVLAEATFDAFSIAQIDLPLPADDEYQVHFIAEGKAPGFYVATTAMSFPTAGSGGEVLFVARDLVTFEQGVFTVDEAGSYVELSQPNLQGCIGPRMGTPSSGNCNPSPNSTGIGDRFPPRWLPAFARTLKPGRIAYLSETDQPGFSELFTVETATPGLAVKLSGPEVGGPEGFRVVDYRSAPSLPERLVYKVVGSEAPAPNLSVTGPGNPGLLYAVDVTQPEQRRLLPRPSAGHWVIGWEMDAVGRRVVFETWNLDSSLINGHLYAVELDSTTAPARQVSHFDRDAGDRLQRFAISPDGRWLAYSVRLEGDTVRYEGFLVDLDDPDGDAVRISNPLHVRVRELRFAPDSQSLVYRLASSSQLDNIGELYWVDLSNPGQPAAPVRLGLSSDARYWPEQWRIAPTSDRVVGWSGRNLRETRFATPQTEVLRLQLPFGANLGRHVLYAPDGETLLMRFIPGTGMPWGLLRHPPGAASGEFEVLIEPLDFTFQTSGVAQFALSVDGQKVDAAVEIDNGSRHTILQVSLGAQPAVTTLVPAEDGSRVLLLLNPAFIPWMTFGVLSQ